MTDQPVKRSKPARKPFMLLALVAGGVVSLGLAVGVKMMFFNTPAAEDEAEHEESHEAPPPADHSEPPSFQRLTLAVRSGNYSVGLKCARELLGGHPGGHAEHAEPAEHAPRPDPPVQYALALCLEGLGRWDDAIEAYQTLGADDAPNGVKAVAACGEVRCHLAAGEMAEATGALVRAERLAAGVTGLMTELDYLRGRIAYRTLAPPKPGPFAPDRPMDRSPSLPPAEYFVWLALPTSATVVGGAPPPTTSASDPGATALAAFNAVLAAEPPHPDEPAVRLTVANLMFRAGKLDDAAREYKRVRDSHPPEVVTVAATYNLGLIRHRRGEMALARQLFTDAADLGVHTPAASVAWWWAGRVELDNGNVDTCLAAWMRADETDDREMTAAVLLGRVFLKLLDGELERAEKLFHGQRLVNIDPIPALGEAFECYFRFANRASDLNRGELAAAVHHADDGAGFGPAGQLLFGGWLGEAGRGARMLETYEAASETARGIWAVRIAHSAGEHLFASGQLTAAKARFTAVAAADGGELGDRARVRLAEIALSERRPDECVRLCRVVLTRDHAERRTVLRLLGRGYEQLNRPRAAAECFAGRLPPP